MLVGKTFFHLFLTLYFYLFPLLKPNFSWIIGNFTFPGYPYSLPSPPWFPPTVSPTVVFSPLHFFVQSLEYSQTPGGQSLKEE